MNKSKCHLVCRAVLATALVTLSAGWLDAAVSRDCLVLEYVFSGSMNDTAGILTGNWSGVSRGAVLTNDRTGKPRSALYLDGKSFVEVHDSENFSLGDNDYSLSCWVWFDQAEDTDWVRIFGKGEWFIQDFGLFYRYSRAKDSADILFQTVAVGDRFPLEAQVPSHASGRWLHLAVVKEGEKGTIYINGVMAAGKFLYFRDVRSVEWITIGYAGFGSRHTGMIDDIRVYRRALTKQEVAALFHDKGR